MNRFFLTPEQQKALVVATVIVQSALAGDDVELTGGWPPEFVELIQACTVISGQIQALTLNEALLRQQVQDLTEWIEGPSQRDKRLRN